MSYSIILNSNNRVDTTTTSNDATYNFDWSVLERGEYKVNWNLTTISTVAQDTTTYITPDILWYKFETGDSTNGTNLKNYVSGDYLATCSTTGMLSTAQSAVGTGSLLMDGTNSVNLNSTNTLLNAFSDTQSQSYSVWFRCTSDTPNASTIMVPFVFAYAGQYTHTTFAIKNNGTGLLKIERTNYGGQYIGMETNSFSVNTWNHFATTATNTSSGNWDLRSYFNGVLLTGPYASFHTLLSGGGSSYMGSGNITGGLNGYTGNCNFIGYIDDLRVFNSVLTAGQILSIYNKTG
jgi:hypothetical protein